MHSPRQPAEGDIHFTNTIYGLNDAMLGLKRELLSIAWRSFACEIFTSPNACGKFFHFAFRVVGLSPLHHFPRNTKSFAIGQWKFFPVKITNRMLRTRAAFMSRISECSKDFSVEMLSGVTLFLDLLCAVVSAYTIAMSSSWANAFIWRSNLFRINM